MVKEGALITRVIQHSIAEELGVEPGDRLLKINGHALEDLIDYQFLISDEYLEVELNKANGEEWVLEVEKELQEDLGLEFAEATFDGIKRCGNQCVFCFVEQMPPGMRETLYVKDDDYRMSFLHGNFITFTNLSEKNLQRIIRMRLSPLYISVHTTNPELRQKMLNSVRAGKLIGQLKQLAAAGIELHTQVVTCPGLNDGPELARTIRELGNLYPAVQSIAIVPVGLTKYREKLYPLRLFTAEEAQQVIVQVTNFQQEFWFKNHRFLVYAADEFYLMAGLALPEATTYEDFPQTENGVGLVRLFLDSFQQEKPKIIGKINKPTKLLLVTGKSAGKLIQNLAAELNLESNLMVKVVIVPNHYFGETVTVAGLLTGQDLVSTLLTGSTQLDSDTIVCIPSVMLKAGEAIFLDGMTLQAFAEQLGNPIKVLDMEHQAADLINLVLALQENQ